jgi:queuosine precursor transporter
MPDEKPAHHFRYYDLALGAFVAVLLCTNLIGAAKIADVFGATFGAGILFFPLSYVLGDILTEVYGYGGARRAVWAGFAANLFAVFMAFAVVSLPPAEDWGGQEHYAYVFGQTPRIVLASLIAFWAGEFANAYVMAEMKLMSEGKNLWQRTIGSTVVGQGIDSLIFYPVAFLGIWSISQILQVMMLNYVLKVLWEAILTPVTYYVIGRLKKAEGVEIFDRGTNFSPFSLKK